MTVRHCRLTRSTTQNVAAILEGTDPTLKQEYVVFSAHTTTEDRARRRDLTRRQMMTDFRQQVRAALLGHVTGEAQALG